MNWIPWVDFMGTFVFAISGATAAIEKKFDVFGVLILALVTAIGGGTLRDLLIGSTPVAWLTNNVYVYIVLIAVPVAFLFEAQIKSLRKGIFLFDTLGIGLFTILGIEKTLNVGLSPIAAVMMGVFSAVFGGVIRDVLSNEVPLIFRGEIYASACLAGAMTYLAIKGLGNEQIAMYVSIITVIAIRILSIRFNWSLNLPQKR
ncbi:MAG: putative membrane protein YeiH, partial [Arcticibacterium sp.]